LPLHAPSVHTWIALAGAAVEGAPRAAPPRASLGLDSAGSPASKSTGSLPGAGVRVRAPAPETLAPPAGLFTDSTPASAALPSAALASTLAHTSASRRRWRNQGMADPITGCYKPRRRPERMLQEKIDGSHSPRPPRRRARRHARTGADRGLQEG